MLSDDVVADGESEAGPLAHILGCEKWLEHPVDDLRRYSLAGVTVNRRRIVTLFGTLIDPLPNALSTSYDRKMGQPRRR